MIAKIRKALHAVVHKKVTNLSYSHDTYNRKKQRNMFLSM